MNERPKIYLAGPEVFLADAKDICARKRELCAALGFEGLVPFDNEAPPAGDRRDLSIYRANVAMIREADCGVFNLTQFRGPHSDAGDRFRIGTSDRVWEAGLRIQQRGRGLAGPHEARRTGRLRRRLATWVDESGMAIEDFGNADNLMIDACLSEQGARSSGVACLRLISLRILMDLCAVSNLRDSILRR